MKLQTGRQWVKVSLCPVRTANLHSPFPVSTFTFFLSTHLSSAPSPFGLWQSLGRASTSLGILAGGALCLRGWWGPRVSCGKTWQTIHKKIRDAVCDQDQKWIGNKSALRLHKEKKKSPEEGTATSCGSTVSAWYEKISKSEVSHHTYQH